MAPAQSPATTSRLLAPSRPANLLYAVGEKPPLWMTVLLGLQHVCIQFVGLTFAVILMRVSHAPAETARAFISLAMIAGGIATITQTLRRGPVGSGYLVPEGPDASFMSASLQALHAGGLPLLAGMTAIAGLFQGLLSQGLYRLRMLFPPEVTGLIVVMVGLSVVPLAIEDFFGGGEGAHGMSLTTTGLSVLTLALLVGINLWGPGRTKQFSLIIVMLAGYALAAGMGLFSGEEVLQVGEAPLLGVPWMSGLRYAFSWALVPSFLIAVTCATLKSVGDLTTCQKANDAHWRRVDMHSVRGGIMSGSLGTLLGGLLGGMGQASQSENIGLSLATGVTSRVVGIAAGALLIGLAFFPKVAAALLMMPPFVIGATHIFCISFMIAAGVQIITSRMLDERKTFVMGFALIFGLGVNVLPELFRNVPSYLEPIFSSSLSLATVLAIVLNLLLRLGVAESVRLAVTPGPEAVDAIYKFMETHGAHWGARREVIQRATAALVEIAEALAGGQLATGEVEITAHFDELNLNVEVRYPGRPLVYGRSAPAAEELLEDETAMAKMAGYLVRQHADSLKAQEKDGVCEVLMHFDH